MIIDGNRRWARQLGFETPAHGHRAGAREDGGVPRAGATTSGSRSSRCYLLSNDNVVKRDPDELADLIEIIAGLAGPALATRRLARAACGTPRRPARAPRSSALRDAERRTSENTGLHVNLAVGYGGSYEIVDAVRQIIQKHDEDGGSLEELAASLTPEVIGEHLYTRGQPDPDLVIRTSGRAAAERLPHLAERAQRVLLRGGARARSARDRFPARDPRLHDQRAPVRQVGRPRASCRHAAFTKPSCDTPARRAGRSAPAA